ncbi:MAG TPA: CsgG/HfaB family protein [bacterium]|nr:CsgG/HfaB family protein [bacterium]
MVRLLAAVFSGLITATLFLSCASTYSSRGHQALDRADYDQAIRELKAAIAEDYRNIPAIRDMGIALFHKGKISIGQKFLQLALSQRPNDLTAQYYLGLTFEAQGRLDKAADLYRRYAEISPFNAMRKQVETRLWVLVQKQMETQIKALLQTESAIDVAAIPDHSVAVLYFVNSSGNAEIDPLQKGLTEMLITDLSQVKALTVVERARLQQLMEEMGLGMSGLIREDTAPRLGKLLGAARVVHGAITGLADRNLRIDVSLADLKKADRIAPGSIQGTLLEFYQLEKDLAFAVIEGLQVPLSREERDAIQRIPTKNLLAFLAFCRGLDEQDLGHWDAARREFNDAVAQDPGFQLAAVQLERVNALSSFTPGVAMPPSFTTNLEPAEKQSPPSAPKPEGASVRPSELPVSDLLNRTAANISTGFIPSVESRKPTTENSSGSLGATVPLPVRIRLPIKP